MIKDMQETLHAEEGRVGIRENTMFNNIVRLHESSEPPAKIIVWVHNAHAAKSPVGFLHFGRPENARLELLGTMLNRKYGEDVKSFGMASLVQKREGSRFTESPLVLDHVFSRTGLELCFLNVDKWKSQNQKEDPLESPWKLTADQGGYLSLVPAQAFDGLFFIKHTTGVRLSLISAQRFKGLF